MAVRTHPLVKGATLEKYDRRNFESPAEEAAWGFVLGPELSTP